MDRRKRLINQEQALPKTGLVLPRVKYIKATSGFEIEDLIQRGVAQASAVLFILFTNNGPDKAGLE